MSEVNSEAAFIGKIRHSLPEGFRAVSIEPLKHGYRMLVLQCRSSKGERLRFGYQLPSAAGYSDINAEGCAAILRDWTDKANAQPFHGEAQGVGA